MRRIGIPSILMLLLAPAAESAWAETDERRWELGPRIMLLNAGGEPTNDMLGVGVYGWYRLHRSWLLGFEVDSTTGDFERPYEIVGLTSPEEIDSTMDSLVFSGWVAREYGKPDKKLRWFWAAGLGFASTDVDDVTGPTTGGGTFDITTDPGSEILISAGGGLRRTLGRRLRLEVGIRLGQHFTDWKVEDRVSGQTGAIHDYTTTGLNVGLAYAF